jgi:hypothetical protein
MYSSSVFGRIFEASGSGMGAGNKARVEKNGREWKRKNGLAGKI